MLESCLQSESKVREMQSEMDTAILRVHRMRSRLREKTDSLARRQQELLDAEYHLRRRQSEATEIINKMETTSTSIASINNRIEQEKNMLSAGRESLEKRRARLIQELATWIYPVSLDTPVPTICGFMLPDISSPAGSHEHSGSTSASVNGSVSTPSPYSWSQFILLQRAARVHMILRISKFTDIPPEL